MSDLHKWSTQRIFDGLAQLGITHDVDSFRATVRRCGSCDRVMAEWDALAPAVRETGTFALDAVYELWQRLAADIACPELLGERVLDAMDTFVETHGGCSDSECAAFADVLTYLAHAPENDREYLFARVLGESPDSIRDAFGAFIQFEAGSPDQARAWATLLCDCDPDGRLAYNGGLSLALARRGQAQEAEELVSALRSEFPSSRRWRYFSAAVYSVLERHADALDVAKSCMRVADDWKEWSRAATQAAVALERLGRANELQQLVSRIPPPAATPYGAVDTDAAPGRNDPCPCGSGRKYKKCCLASDDRSHNSKS